MQGSELHRGQSPLEDHGQHRGRVADQWERRVGFACWRQQQCTELLARGCDWQDGPRPFLPIYALDRDTKTNVIQSIYEDFPDAADLSHLTELNHQQKEIMRVLRVH
ncbi:MAG: hypothetical protein AUK47_27580 [Deltaproteobacteria bacterium CG2_30_63_29]|nr:MAG: hypothetical protein AUK47_27580 [Deltaproteobacteria bacterium CG2_30_63_29]